MRVNTEQQKEIETIKKRTITLELSDADCLRISKKAGSAGLTVGQLLASFIGDLVGGTYSNGSDERMNADNWFERCWFSWMADKTLLKYMLDWDLNIDDLLTLWDEIQYYKENPEEYAEELEFAKSEGDNFIWCEQEFNDLIKEFLEQQEEPEKIDLNKEIENCRQWLQALKEFQGIETE